MPAQFSIREGVTDPIIFTMLSIDPDTEEGTAVNLAGVTFIDLRLKSKDSSVILNFGTDGSQLEITSAANGQVTFSPAATDFDADEDWYIGYFRVTDAGGKLIDFPNDGTCELVIESQF